MPKLTKEITAVAPGEIYPRLFEAGTDVDGRLAEIAVALGALPKKAGKPAKTKSMKPLENK